MNFLRVCWWLHFEKVAHLVLPQVPPLSGEYCPLLLAMFSNKKLLGGMEHGHEKMEAMVTFFLQNWEFFSLLEVQGNGFIPALLHPGLDYTDDFQSATGNNFK